MWHLKHSMTVCMLLWVATVYGQENGSTSLLYQLSTYGMLKEGAFEGEWNIREVKKHGDMGLGTFNGLDGEMVAFDGDFYYIDLDGTARLAADSARVPFVQVTTFGKPRGETLQPFANYAELQGKLDALILNKNVVYAIQVSGKFHSLRMRSLPKQTKPYAVLDTVVARQKVSHLNDVEGTMIGFWSPPSVGQLSAVGYHFHFLSQDRSRGGHILDLDARTPVTAQVQAIDKYEMVFQRGEERSPLPHRRD